MSRVNGTAPAGNASPYLKAHRPRRRNSPAKQRCLAAIAGGFLKLQNCILKDSIKESKKKDMLILFMRFLCHNMHIHTAGYCLLMSLYNIWWSHVDPKRKTECTTWKNIIRLRWAPRAARRSPPASPAREGPPSAFASPPALPRRRCPLFSIGRPTLLEQKTGGYRENLQLNGLKNL